MCSITAPKYSQPRCCQHVLCHHIKEWLSVTTWITFSSSISLMKSLIHLKIYGPVCGWSESSIDLMKLVPSSQYAHKFITLLWSLSVHPSIRNCIYILSRPPSAYWDHCSPSDMLFAIEALTIDICSVPCNLARVFQLLHKRDQTLGHRAHWKELPLHNTTCLSNDVTPGLVNSELKYFLLD